MKKKLIDWTSSKWYSFAFHMTLLRRWKGATSWEKIFEYISRTCTQSVQRTLQPSNKKQISPIKNIENTWKDTLQKTTYKWPVSPWEPPSVISHQGNVNLNQHEMPPPARSHDRRCFQTWWRGVAVRAWSSGNRHTSWGTAVWPPWLHSTTFRSGWLQEGWGHTRTRGHAVNACNTPKLWVTWASITDKWKIKQRCGHIMEYCSTSDMIHWHARQ